MLVHRGLKHCRTLRYRGMFIILLLTGFLMITVSFSLSGRSSTTFDFNLELNITKAQTSVRLSVAYKASVPCHYITVAVLVIHNYSSH